MKYNFKLYFFLLFAVAFLAYGCNNVSVKTDNIVGIYHYNITIAPDLSNRVNMNIHPKPIDDRLIIGTILNSIPEFLHLGHRDTDQKDCYSLSFINKGLIRMYEVNQENFNIDFEEFENQLERIDFIKGRNKHSDCSLQKRIQSFNNECCKLYNNAINKTDGADLWSYLQTTVDLTNVKKDHKPFDYAGAKFQHRFKNVLILFTDGYIECGLSTSASSGLSKNQSYDLGQSRIKRFRRAFRSSGMTNIKEFFKKEKYGIVPLKNKYLEDINILVVEMYDRSLTNTGNATVHPTDAEIMNLFWTDWFNKSKVKYFELNQCFSSKKKAKQVISNFITTINE